MKLINLKTNKLGQNFKYYEKIDSTQSEIWRLVDSDKIAEYHPYYDELIFNELPDDVYKITRSEFVRPAGPIIYGELMGRVLMAEYGTQTKLKILPFLSM